MPTQVAIVLFLDELDALKPHLLYRVLEWTLKYSESLVVITIANTLTLPERLAPKVYSRLRPKRLFVQPYTFLQLTTIIKDRLGAVPKIFG